MRFLIPLAIFVALVASGLGLLLRNAGGQGHPPIGSDQHWYDAECCSERDCAPIPARAVEFESSGFRVTLYPGDHHFVTSRQMTFFVDYGDEHRSRDQEFHACIGPGESGEMGLICLYVPGLDA